MAQAQLINKQNNAGKHQRQQIINNPVSNQRPEQHRLIVLAGNNKHKQPLKHAQTARNLAEYPQNLGNQKDPDENVKRNVHKRNQ